MAGRDGGWLAGAQESLRKLWSGQPGRVRASARPRNVQAMPTAQYRPAPVEHWSQRRQLGHYQRPVRRAGGHKATTLVIVVILIGLGVLLLYAVSSWLSSGTTRRGGPPTPAAAAVSPTAATVV